MAPGVHLAAPPCHPAPRRSAWVRLCPAEVTLVRENGSIIPQKMSPTEAKAGAGRTGLHKAAVLHPSVSPRRARGGGAAGDSAERLRASQLQPPSWPGRLETWTRRRWEHTKSSRSPVPKLKHSPHALFIPIYLPPRGWMPLVGFFLSCDQAFQGFRQAAAKDSCSRQRGLKKAGGKTDIQTRGGGGKHLEMTLVFALKSQQHGRA